MSARVRFALRLKREPSRTVLLVDLQLAVKVYAQHDQVRQDVERAEAVDDVGVFHGDLLGRLDQEEDDDQVGAALEGQRCAHISLRISHCGIHLGVATGELWYVAGGQTNGAADSKETRRSKGWKGWKG
jgi:hypothetical protein